MTELQHYALWNATAEKNAADYLGRRRNASAIENIVMQAFSFAVVIGIIVATGLWLNSKWLAIFAALN
jgi:hypothetical protein